VIPLSWSLDHVGPMCRAAADTALLLEAIAGYDPLEPTSVDWPVERYSTAALRMKTARLRVGVVRGFFFEQVDPEIEAAVNAAVDVIRKLVAEVRDAELPSVPDLAITPAEAYAFHAAYFEKTPNLYQPYTRERLRLAAAVTASQYIEARRELDRLRRSAGSVFSALDLLLTPTTPMPPITIEAAAKLAIPPAAGVGDSSVRNTRPFNVFGLPAISIPCGFMRDGMPIGLQIAGPRFGGSRVLALAHAYQQSTDWHLRQPAI
jgi:aspartyl-tRNA(Asn)/glutamyl-tRNA(Gln) amidotransferase subunit A